MQSLIASVPTSWAIWLVFFTLGVCYAELARWMQRHPNTKPVSREAMRSFIQWEIARMKGGEA